MSAEKQAIIDLQKMLKRLNQTNELLRGEIKKRDTRIKELSVELNKQKRENKLLAHTSSYIKKCVENLI